MTKVGVIYFSGNGATARFADALCEGLASGGVDVHRHQITGAEIEEGRWSNQEVADTLDGCDAIVFGTPTYMGGVSAQLKSFFDAMVTRWYQQAWNGKFGAAFTVSAKTSGDKLNCLQDILTFAMQMGMVWIGASGDLSEESGFYLGIGGTAMNVEAVNPAELENAFNLGARVARITTGAS